MMRRLVTILVVFVMAFGFAGGAMAKKKKKGKSLTKKQQQLNENAVEALIDGDYSRAIGLLKLSLDVGELNITYLNLGRAYAKSGECRDAMNAYDKVSVAPQVSEPSPEKINEILGNYREDLYVECPGSVIIRCQPKDLQISIDDGERQACPDDVMMLSPGEHNVAGYLEDRVVTQQIIRVEALGSATVDLKALDQVQDRVPATVIRSGGISVLEVSGWTAIGVGVGVLTAALIVDTVVIANDVEAFDAAIAREDLVRARELKDTIDTNQTINMALFISGGSLALIGTGLVIWGYVDRSDSDIEGSVMLSPDGAGFQMRARF